MQQSGYERQAAPIEQPGYFAVPGAHLYTVLHPVTDPVARVLLVGPYASERHFSYHPWVRWARYLASRRIEVLRYDYRGVGESTGVFEAATLKDLYEDCLLLADWLNARTPSAPLLLNGLEMGALFAGKAFAAGMADAVLLWSPPANANEVLRANLLRWASFDQFSESFKNRRPASDFIRKLEEGSSVEVHGYRWSGRLWRDSFDFIMPDELMQSDTPVSLAFNRPARVIKLGKDAAPLVKPFVSYDKLKDLSWLYKDNFEWIVSVVNSGKRST